MEGYTHLIWDFNGTILDDVEACIQSADRLLTAHGMEKLRSREDYREMFGFPIIDYYRRMGFDFQKIPYDTLAVEWMNYYFEYSRGIGAYEGIHEALAFAKERGLSQWILSASESELLRRQMRELEIDTYFDGVLGLDNIHAHSKKEIGMGWREKNPDARALMLGDTDHDAEVAAAMGADCVLLTTGHQSRRRLEACQCLFVADSAMEALERLGV